MNTTLLNLAQTNSGSIGKAPAAGGQTARTRILPGGSTAHTSGVASGNGSLTSRLPNGQAIQLTANEAGVFSYHDSSTYSSTIEDESRLMKTAIVSIL
jgi:hypothetical protein